jgi:hypothetical protein
MMSAALCSTPKVVLFVDVWQIDMLGRGPYGAFYHKPASQNRS